jgi:hypothetical protein
MFGIKAGPEAGESQDPLFVVKNSPCGYPITINLKPAVETISPWSSISLKTPNG